MFELSLQRWRDVGVLKLTNSYQAPSSVTAFQHFGCAFTRILDTAFLLLTHDVLLSHLLLSRLLKFISTPLPSSLLYGPQPTLNSLLLLPCCLTMDMAPIASPLSLKRKSQCSQLTSSFPATPAKQIEDTRQANSDKHDFETPTPSPSIRERRGRRNLTNGSFRPLSIFTKSLLLPFDLDIDKGFDILKGESPDRLEEAKQALTPDHKRIKVTQEKEPNKLTQTPDNPLGGLSFKMATTIMGSCRDSEMDLMTALKMTSPERDTTRKIHADFATLCAIPVPEPSQHPAFSSNPFEITTDVPLLSTSTSINEIRLHNPKIRRSDESSARARQDSIERKRSFFGLEFRTPASAKSHNAFSVDDPPLPLPLSTAATGGSSARSSSSPFALDSAQPRGSASTTGSHGVRKFSDMFKSKASMERSESPSPTWSPRISDESPNLERQDLVSLLQCRRFLSLT